MKPGSDARVAYFSAVNRLADELAVDLKGSDGEDKWEEFYSAFEDFAPGSHSPGDPAFGMLEALFFTANRAEGECFLESFSDEDTPQVEVDKIDSIADIEAWIEKGVRLDMYVYGALRADVSDRLCELGVLVRTLDAEDVE